MNDNDDNNNNSNNNTDFDSKRRGLDPREAAAFDKWPISRPRFRGFKIGHATFISYYFEVSQ